MPPRFPTVISASRRTDIPAFYMPWFMEGVGRGYFDVENPFSGRLSRVAMHPEQIHSIVFWSKNYAPFLSGDYDRRLQAMGFRILFYFTLNSHDPRPEPGVPPLKDRLGN